MSKSFLYERRREYRLHYPVEERPRIIIDDIDYIVQELSEGGMKVLFDKENELPADFPFSGLIRYIDGEEVEVTGKVLRTNDHGFSVQFEKGVGMRRIVADQIRLKKKYPLLFDKAE